MSGSTFRVHLTDGRVFDSDPTPGDIVRFEMLHKTSWGRATDDGEDEPLWVRLAVVHINLKRHGCEVPDDVADFADLIDDLEQVSEGKAEDSAPAPTTG